MALLLLGSLCARAALLAQAMRANLEEHAEERRESALLGFAPFFPSAAFAAPSTLSYTVDQRVLGMGTKSPFDSDALIHESKTPLFSASECHAIREEAAEHMASHALSNALMPTLRAPKSHTSSPPGTSSPAPALIWFDQIIADGGREELVHHDGHKSRRV